MAVGDVLKTNKTCQPYFPWLSPASQARLRTTKAHHVALGREGSLSMHA